ncbi:MAG: DUF6930 domain-containing protein [Anaerolineae bacterium]
MPLAEPPPISLVMDLDLLEKAKHLPRSRLVLEVDFMMPTPIEEKGKRPFFPYMLLIVDRDSGMVLGSEVLTPEAGLEAMWGTIPLMLTYQLDLVRVVPRRINVRSLLLNQLLQPLAEVLGFEIKTTPTLHSLNQAKKFLFDRFDTRI